MATSDAPEIFAEEKIVFSIHSHFTEEEYKRMVYKTRENERHKKALFMLLVTAVCTVIGLCSDQLKVLFFALFMLICIGYNYVNPLIFTSKHIRAIKEKYGTAEHITECNFTDESVTVIFERWNMAIYPQYDQITRFYVKDSWLFFCAENLRGFYMRKPEIDDLNKLIDFVKEKNPSVKILK